MDENGARKEHSWRVLGLFVAIPIAIASVYVLAGYFEASAMLADGVVANARLLRLTDDGCNKCGCDADAAYAFTPRGSSRTIRGVMQIPSRDGGHSSAVYDYVTSTGTVPIAYRRDKPDQVMLCFGDMLQRQGSISYALKTIALFSILVLLGMSPLIFGTWRVMRKRAMAQSPRTE